MDVDVAGDAASKYGVSAMPTFFVLDKNGNKVDHVVGGGQANVDKMINAAKNAK